MLINVPIVLNNWVNDGVMVEGVSGEKIKLVSEIEVSLCIYCTFNALVK